MKAYQVAVAQMSITDLDAWYMANVGYSFIADAGGLDAYLQHYDDCETRATVAEMMELLKD